MNKVIICGNLTKDMDVMVSKNDVNIGKFTVAVNNGYGENTNTQFYPVILFGKRVEALQKYLLKGTKVIIDGQIDYNSIQDDEGNWKNYFQLIANDIDIVKFVEVQEDKKSNNKYKKNFRKQATLCQKIKYIKLDECSHTLNLIKIKTKNKKKEYRQIENIIKNIKYVDDERIESDKTKILEELAKLKVEEYKLKKIFYRLNVCITILNSELE